jgi:hypothetical protein
VFIVLKIIKPSGMHGRRKCEVIFAKALTNLGFFYGRITAVEAGGFNGFDHTAASRYSLACSSKILLI